MTNELANILFGPLVVPECRRSVGRGWVILFRTLAALAFVSVVLTVVWLWWINQDYESPLFNIRFALRVGLTLLISLMLTIGLAMSPAVLASSLAGENERGSMGLLLTTAAKPREIVLGRMIGKLSPIAMILFSGVPPLLFLGFLAGVQPIHLILMVSLPMVVAFGAGGITAAASTVSRRGRDALLGSYLLGLFLLLVPVARQALWPGPTGSLIDLINPFLAIVPLVWSGDLGPAWITLGIWGGLGLAGTVLACWRLRPNSLKWLGGEPRRRLGGRRWKLPAIGDRPMLWKELYIERGGRLGGFGRWLGYLLVAFLIFSSSILAGLIAWATWQGRTALVSQHTVLLQELIVDTNVLFAILIQWAVGLRAAVSIASERERGTWDALLTSPLEGREIVLGKLGGSLYALRWLFLAVLYAWGIAVILEAYPLQDFVFELGSTVVVSTFMAAIGMRTSLTTKNVAWAMALAIAGWFLALTMVSLLALLLIGIGALVLFVTWLLMVRFGLAQSAGPWFPLDFSTAFGLLFLTLFVLITLMLIVETRIRFDRIAGRMTGGVVAVSVDQWFHGQPGAPVRIEEQETPIMPTPPVRRASASELGDSIA